MAENTNLRVYISDQPASTLLGYDYITADQEDYFHRDIQSLLETETAEFHGRAYQPNTGAVYQIFTLEGKRILVEDPNGTRILQSLFETDGQLRELNIR